MQSSGESCGDVAGACSDSEASYVKRSRPRDDLTHNERVLACLVGLSLVLKLSAFAAIWGVDPQRVVTGDTASYENPARALVETGWFTAGIHQGAEPETLRTPGYPLFLAGL